MTVSFLTQFGEPVVDGQRQPSPPALEPIALRSLGPAPEMTGVETVEVSLEDMNAWLDTVPEATYRPLAPMQRDILQLLYAGWATPLEALQKANCLSLSQRAGELSRMGYRIEKTWRELPSGKTVRAYRIEP